MALATMLAPVDSVDGLLRGGSMEPMTAAMISAGSNVLGKALGGASAGPSGADSGGNNWFDVNNSGWTVATGASRADAVAGLAFPVWGWAALALVAVVWLKRKNA